MHMGNGDRDVRAHARQEYQERIRTQTTADMDKLKRQTIMEIDDGKEPYA